MKLGFIVLLFTSLFSSTLAAGKKDWFVKTDPTGEFYLLTHKKDSKHFSQIESVGGEPYFVREMPFPRGNMLLIYFAGTAGTSSPISIHRAVLYNLKTKRFLGDFPYSYRSHKKARLAQPKWDVKGNVLVINDQSTDEVWTVELP